MTSTNNSCVGFKKDVLKRIKGGKAMGPDRIPIEVWRSLGDVVIV
jgi:hypothetical protein